MTRFLALAGAAIAVMLAAACSTFAPGDPDLINDRLRPGQGLLSGAGGEFVLYPAKQDPPKPKTD